MAEASLVGTWPALPGLMEIGFDFGGQAGQRHADVVGYGRRRRAALAKPKTAYMRGSMLPPHHLAEIVHTIDVAGLGI